MSEMQSRSLPKFETTILSPFTQIFKSLFCFLHAKGKYSIEEFVCNVNKCGSLGGKVELVAGGIDSLQSLRPTLSTLSFQLDSS